MEVPLNVIDTNVFVSGVTLSPRPNPPEIIVEAWRNGDIEVATSEKLLAELEITLAYPKVQKFTNMSQHEQKSFIDEIRGSSTVVATETFFDVSPDPDDNELFSCAVEAGANYVISGDKKHILCIPEFRGVQTISPRDFVETVLPKIQYEKTA